LNSLPILETEKKKEKKKGSVVPTGARGTAVDSGGGEGKKGEKGGEKGRRREMGERSLGISCCDCVGNPIGCGEEKEGGEKKKKKGKGRNHVGGGEVLVLPSLALLVLLGCSFLWAERGGERKKKKKENRERNQNTTAQATTLMRSTLQSFSAVRQHAWSRRGEKGKGGEKKRKKKKKKAKGKPKGLKAVVYS